MQFDLHYSIAGVTPLSQAGQDYLNAGCPNYEDAKARGLHVSFENKLALDTIDTDPGSTSVECWEPFREDGYSNDAYPLNSDNEEIEEERGGM